MKEAIKTLSAMASAYERLGDLARDLRARPEVESATVAMTLRKYENRTGPTAEMYVDVELRNGNALNWSIDLSWSDDGSCVIEALVGTVHAEGQDTLRSFPDRTARTVGEFSVQLDQAANALLASIDCISEAVNGE